MRRSIHALIITSISLQVKTTFRKLKSSIETSSKKDVSSVTFHSNLLVDGKDHLKYTKIYGEKKKKEEKN